MANANKLIILDRDGVINQDSDAYIKSVDEFQPISGSIEAIAKLYKSGYQIAIATNQSGIARGYFSEHTLTAMHQKLEALLDKAGGKIAHVAYCPHGPDDNCDCRKPKAGLIHQIEAALNISAQGAYMVGDSIRDLQAGVQAGCKPILVKTGKGEKSLKQLADYPKIQHTQIFSDLNEFALKKTN